MPGQALVANVPFVEVDTDWMFGFLAGTGELTGGMQITLYVVPGDQTLVLVVERDGSSRCFQVLLSDVVASVVAARSSVLMTKVGRGMAALEDLTPEDRERVRAAVRLVLDCLQEQAALNGHDETQAVADRELEAESQTMRFKWVTPGRQVQRARRLDMNLDRGY